MWVYVGYEMPKKAKELSALAVSRLSKPGRWAVGGVDGLCLQVTENAKKEIAKSWLLRLSVGGARREMGLGSFSPSGKNLAWARAEALKKRAELDEGKDPIAERKANKSQAAAQLAGQKTFKWCMGAYITSHESGWKAGGGQSEQWTNSLTTYALPFIGKLLIRDVTTADVLRILEQPADPTQPSGPNLWNGKNPTANHVRNRIQLVWEWARARGYCSGDNPAKWRGHLDATLPEPAKVNKTEHHAAVALGQMPSFVARLRELSGTATRALEFTVLTAARSGETRGATWGEIDLQAKTWNVPASRMKAGRAHTVPLSDAAIELLQALPQGKPGELVFPGTKPGRPLVDTSMLAVLKRMKVAATVHGFRSAFKDWASEHTEFPNEVSEMALAHTIESKVERAYRRGDLLAKRTAMMTAWAKYLEGKQRHGDNVIPMPRTAA